MKTWISWVALSSVASAQSFQFRPDNVPQGPFNSGFSENVDFGDVDLDGDLDAVLADGGDFGNEQNRLWINMGGAQGGTPGVFVDETASRFPAILDTSRDVELADIDLDGDLDLYVDNTSTIVSQSSRMWINMGGQQGGSAGFFQDETQTRWINLGKNDGQTTFSSLPASMTLPSGGFIDWSCDADFADLDLDGDLDLFHSSYGGVFGGQVPSRLFLNDGAGFFEEFNPSGYQLPNREIRDGDPALWAQGQQEAGTGNTNGARADIATTALDIELADYDGDLDLDILHGARDEQPRMFRNMISETGVLAFRDVTHAWFPPNWSIGIGHYEQESGDLDDDGDLDLYGVNWLQVAGFGFQDATLENLGSGAFGPSFVVDASQKDDNEADFFDYDNDGDLDVFVASFAGRERLYRNNLVGGSYSLAHVTGQELPNDDTVSLDADVADVDGDADYDLIVANDNGVANALLENISQRPDKTAPRPLRLEQAPDRASGAEATVVRVQVYDNVPYYRAWEDTVVVEYNVNGGPVLTRAMSSSGGQLFRGEIPGEPVGVVCYRVRATDPYGNTAVTPILCYDATCGPDIQVYCTAKTLLVCGPPQTSFTGTPSASANSGFEIVAKPARGGDLIGFLVYSDAGRAGQPFQGGFLCVNPTPLLRTIPVSSGGPQGLCDGRYAIDMNAFANGVLGGNPDPFLTAPGTVVNTQWWGRDSVPTGSLLSRGLEYRVCP